MDKIIIGTAVLVSAGLLYLGTRVTRLIIRHRHEQKFFDRLIEKQGGVLVPPLGASQESIDRYNRAVPKEFTFGEKEEMKVTGECAGMACPECGGIRDCLSSKPYADAQGPPSWMCQYRCRKCGAKAKEIHVR